jgi:hypothetical protein
MTLLRLATIKNLIDNQTGERYSQVDLSTGAPMQYEVDDDKATYLLGLCNENGLPFFEEVDSNTKQEEVVEEEKPTKTKKGGVTRVVAKKPANPNPEQEIEV